jgi:hypothetical protein
MSEDTKTKTIPIYIDSNDRDPNISSSATDFTMTLHKTLRNVRRIDIASVELEHSWYNVDKNNNTLLISVIISGTEGIFALTIPIGEYSVETLRVAVQLALNSITPAPSTSSVTFNTATYKYTITTPFQAHIFSSGFLSEMLGFYSMSFNYVFSRTSDGIASTKPHKYLFIKSNALANNINTSYVSSLNKKFIVDATNNVFAVVAPSLSTTGIFPITFPYLGSYSIDEIIIILQKMLNFGTGFLTIKTWVISFDVTLKKVTIKNNTLPFYIAPTDTMSSLIFNIPRSTTNVASIQQIGNEIDFSMHKNVISKIRVLNTTFAIQHVFSNSEFKQENDYGKSLDLNALDFQVVDSYDRVIDLNGKGISFTLLISSNS